MLPHNHKIAAPASGIALTFKAERQVDRARPAIFASLIRKPKAFPELSSPQQTSATSYWTDLSMPPCTGAWERAYLVTPCSIVARTKGVRSWV